MIVLALVGWPKRHAALGGTHLREVGLLKAGVVAGHLHSTARRRNVCSGHHGPAVFHPFNVRGTALHSTDRHSLLRQGNQSVQHTTQPAQLGMAQHSMAQHSTAQHSTAQRTVRIMAGQGRLITR